MKRVYIARGTAEAHLVRVFLENDGIRAIVRGESLSSAFGGIPIDADSLPSVWVLEDADFNRAVELVEKSTRGPVEAEDEEGAPNSDGPVWPPDDWAGDR